MDDRTLCKRIRVLAEKRQLSLRELADRADMDYKALIRSLSGRRRIPAVELPLYAEALETSMEAILGLEEK